MTEYWVSQAKHWCEYCRIYIGGSKQSIAFHEAGKKHKEIVELSLKDMRMRGREKRKQDGDFKREMEKIERNAMKDYMAQDVAGMPAAHPAAAAAVPADRAARLAELEARISADKMARAFETAGGGAALPPGWAALTNPDGKVYYEHAASGAIQWEPPTIHNGGGGGGASSSGGASSGGDGSTHAVGSTSSTQDRGGWQQGWTEHGVCYYYHMQRGVTQWEPPAEWTVPAEPPAAGCVASADGGGAVYGDEQSAASMPPADDGAAADARVKTEDGASAGAADDAPGGADSSAVDGMTGLGAWTVVTEADKQAEGGGGYEGRGEKRARVAWATNRAQVEEEEEADRLNELQMTFAIPDDMKAAVAKAEAAEREAAEAAEEAAKGTAVFARRKGPAKGAIRKK